MSAEEQRNNKQLPDSGSTHECKLRIYTYTGLYPFIVSSLGKCPPTRVSAHPPRFSLEGLSAHGRLRGIVR